MRIERLRPLPSPETLAAMYATPHDHRRFGRGHHQRVEATIRLACETIPDEARRSVADLSCGNGIIATRIATSEEIWLGDFAQLPDTLLPGRMKLCGPIEETLGLMPEVGTFVLSETVEHLDDPLDVLLDVRLVAEWLVLTTPLECWQDSNAEHLWAWDQAGVESLLGFTEWTSVAFTTVDSRAWGEPYLYGIWVCQ